MHWEAKERPENHWNRCQMPLNGRITTVVTTPSFIKYPSKGQIQPQTLHHFAFTHNWRANWIDHCYRKRPTTSTNKSCTCNHKKNQPTRYCGGKGSLTTPINGLTWGRGAKESMMGLHHQELLGSLRRMGRNRNNREPSTANESTQTWRSLEAATWVKSQSLEMEEDIFWPRRRTRTKTQ